MIEQTVEFDLYEPPAMVEAGEFTEVTMGPRREGTMDANEGYYR
ncbi:lasso RiPP family leader peptide-containing protein [Streptomyces celluloflavus]